MICQRVATRRVYDQTMSNREENLIWYAAYGSNCSAARFNIYLTGGEIPGTNQTQRGSRDSRPPRAIGAVEFPHEIYFCSHSHLWNGAPAFLGHLPSSNRAFGRRYLITWAQFDDIVAQECQRKTTTVDLAGLAPGDRRTVGPGRYSNLVALNPVDGIPAVTFTSPTPPEAEKPAPPSKAYLTAMVNGLVTGGAHSIDEIVTRLLMASGVRLRWDRSTIESLIQPPNIASQCSLEEG